MNVIGYRAHIKPRSRWTVCMRRGWPCGHLIRCERKKWEREDGMVEGEKRSREAAGRENGEENIARSLRHRIARPGTYHPILYSSAAIDLPVSSSSSYRPRTPSHVAATTTAASDNSHIPSPTVAPLPPSRDCFQSGGVIALNDRLGHVLFPIMINGGMSSTFIMHFTVNK